MFGELWCQIGRVCVFEGKVCEMKCEKTNGFDWIMEDEVSAEDGGEGEDEAGDEAEGGVVEAEGVAGCEDGVREAEGAAEEDGREARAARGEQHKGRAQHAEAHPALRERGVQRRREWLRCKAQRQHARRQARGCKKRVAPKSSREDVDCVEEEMSEGNKKRIVWMCNLQP